MAAALVAFRRLHVARQVLAKRAAAPAPWELPARCAPAALLRLSARELDRVAECCGAPARARLAQTCAALGGLATRARLLADLLGAPDLRQELEDRGAARLGVLLHHRYSFDGGASVTGDAAWRSDARRCSERSAAKSRTTWKH